MLEGKAFCCLGCQTVFSLLRENGLGQFYELNSRPGTRICDTAANKWIFLDDPSVQAKLLDYADKKQAKITLYLPAIHCVACVWLLENLFKLHSGVGNSVVHFPRREAVVTFAPDQIKLSELVALLASIGYEPEFKFSSLEGRKTSTMTRKTWLQIGIAGFAFGNVMLMALPFYFGLDSLSGPWFRHLAGWLSLFLALPAVTFSASDFWRSAWLSLRQRTLTMEVPIILGLAALFVASVIDVLSHQGPGYSDTVCGLVFFLLCGRVFQTKTHERLTFDRDYKGFFPLSITRLTKRQPQSGQDSGLFKADLVGSEIGAADEEIIALSQLQVGDRISLRNGELLPADARLIRGKACMDYSFVTGESEPIACAAGSHLYAGGRQVGGAIEVETIKPVAQSYLASLWNNEAFRKKCDTDLDSLTNRFSKYFTFLVVGAALAAAGFWLLEDPTKALKAFIAVLIVACPCALALAAPTTHGSVQRLLSRLKVFLKNAMVVERMAAVDTIVLDKTGTLTCADSTGVEFLEGELSAEESRWVAALTRLSTHPHCVRIATAQDAMPLTVDDFTEVPGSGIQGVIDGHRIQLGSDAWLIQSGIISQDNARSMLLAASGSVVGVAIDGRHRGVFVLQHSLRPEVENLIEQLGSRFELALLSGDNEREATRFGRIFGDGAKLRFNQSPADKLEFIRVLQKSGRKVMMVGDGLNDAGALKQADVGVAVVERAGVFSPASDVILDAAQLAQLAGVLQFARRTALVVRAGFAISTIYNVVGISIAAAGLLSPVICAVLMPLSSATVVGFGVASTLWLARCGGLTARPEPHLHSMILKHA